MACRVGDVASAIERWAPACTAEEGDNVGLLAGRAGSEVHCVLIALDVDEGVVRHAASVGAQMIVAHHPFIYRPVSSLSDGRLAGRLAIAAIEAGVAVFAAHTNLDRALGGVNDALCGEVGLAGAEPAAPGAIARLAAIPGGEALDAFARRVGAALGAPSVRVTGDGERSVRRVCVVSGAGRHDIAGAAGASADCLLTGEIGYHDGQDALGLGLCVVEAGHYETERPVLKHIEKHLQSEFQRLQYTVRTVVYEKSTSPFHHIG